MPLIQTVPPVVEPVAIADAKSHLRVTHTDDDVFIATLIKLARQQIEARTGLILIQQGWSLYLDDWPDGGTIRLPVAPLINVTDIKVWSDADVAAVIDPAHYFEDKASCPPRIVLRGARYWLRPFRVANGIEILMQLGFGATSSAVPEPLRQAILQLIGHWYESRGDEAPAAEPLTVTQLIAPYRLVNL